MNVNAYLKTSLSPYRLNSDAMSLIEQLNLNYSEEIEAKILVLINSASLHPNMSKYQLSLSQKALGDYYYDNAFYQSALEQYNRAISNNSRIPIKRRVKEIMSMPAEKLKSSLSPDMIYDVLQFPEYKEMLNIENNKIQSELESLWYKDSDIISKARQQLSEEAKMKNSIYDKEHELEIERRLNKLGEPYKTEFYRIREVRRLTYAQDDILSLKDHDLLDLESMERSASFSQE